MDRFDVLIVGAGHAGAQVAIVLRQQKFEGSIGIIGDEPDLPYERPPLSKDYLTGEKDRERLTLRPADFWAARKTTLILGVRVTGLDPGEQKVVLNDGRALGYGRLVWAGGGAARTLSCDGGDLSGVHTIRTRADVDALTSELPLVSHVVVIGGGYIGLEAAASLNKLGKRVTIVETMDRVLARVAGESVSRFFEEEHRTHGVTVRLGSTVDRIEGHRGRAVGVHLGTGDRIAAQMVVVGIGIIPAVEPLRAAGATGDNGVFVDPMCRTSLKDVYAIGDCAAHANSFADGQTIRLESVQNANDQAMVCAKSIVGLDAPYRSIPWFWSNQFDLRLQTVGLSSGYDDVVLRGEPSERSFSAIYLKSGKVIALDCINAARDYVQGRGLVMAGASPSRALLKDIQTPLKALLEPS